MERGPTGTNWLISDAVALGILSTCELTKPPIEIVDESGEQFRQFGKKLGVGFVSFQRFGQEVGNDRRAANG